MVSFLIKFVNKINCILILFDTSYKFVTFRKMEFVNLNRFCMTFGVCYIPIYYSVAQEKTKL